MPNTRYLQARMKVAAPGVNAFDPTLLNERTQLTRQRSSQALFDAQQRAAERRIAAQQAAEQQAQEQQAQAQAAIQARIDASKATSAKYQTQTVNQYQKLSIRAQQQQQAANKGPFGAGAAQNPAFAGGTGGQLVAVGGNASKKAAGIINEALKYRGMMYQWGGSSPKTSFDCSGLVQWAYKSMGVALPRVSADQARSGRKVPLANLRPGDLVAWDNSSRNNGADHIAIYIGNGQVIEAARTGTPIRVSKLYDTGRAWGVQILQ